MFGCVVCVCVRLAYLWGGQDLGQRPLPAGPSPGPGRKDPAKGGPKGQHARKPSVTNSAREMRAIAPKPSSGSIARRPLPPPPPAAPRPLSPRETTERERERRKSLICFFVLFRHGGGHSDSELRSALVLEERVLFCALLTVCSQARSAHAEATAAPGGGREGDSEHRRAVERPEAFLFVCAYPTFYQTQISAEAAAVSERFLRGAAGGGRAGHGQPVRSGPHLWQLGRRGHVSHLCAVCLLVINAAFRYNTELLRQLRARIAKFHAGLTVGDIFLGMRHFSSIYSAFLAGYDEAMKVPRLFSHFFANRQVALHHYRQCLGIRPTMRRWPK